MPDSSLSVFQCCGKEYIAPMSKARLPTGQYGRLCYCINCSSLYFIENGGFSVFRRNRDDGKWYSLGIPMGNSGQTAGRKTQVIADKSRNGINLK